jgi:inhibitor of KinA sporulation pathway (predicted exonuclease)
MAKLLDQIPVIDVESSCWKDEPPKDQQSEIIEIGITLLDLRTLLPGEKKSILIKPVLSEISPFCTELTSITPEMVKDGMTLKEAMRIVETYKVGDRCWASWGDYDRRQIEKDCFAKGVKNPMGKTHQNVKSLFAIKHKLQKEVSVPEAMKIIGLEFQGRLHRGDVDSWNIARILATLIK